jgi:2-oxoglutarate ferredoxin oxidoreductase subunit delta
VAKQKVLVLNSAWCKGCGICAAFCPKNALEIVSEKAQLVRPDACILCGQCELRCPDYAIFLKESEGEEMQWVKPY